MKTEFTTAQLADADTAVSAGAIRKCVHCGFCTATCPTYVLLGDELDSPRGRIYLIKNMLEEGRAPTPQDVRHIDRCLSCMACITTCPSGVDYMHLVDHARQYVAQHYRRPLRERVVRWMLAQTLPYRGRFRLALRLAQWTRPVARALARALRLRSIDAMLNMAPAQLPAPVAPVQQAAPAPKGRVILLRGCAEPVLRPQFQAAAVRLLNRLGYAVEDAPGTACCGALEHHLGRTAASLAKARRNIAAWEREMARGDVCAILTTASGCGTTLKDYAHMLREEVDWADRAQRISGLVRDVSEFLYGQDLPGNQPDQPTVVAYHAACSLQHAQKTVREPQLLLQDAGFTVRTPAESHLCCGSAGTYNILQPRIAGLLGGRKTENLEALRPDVIATGNVGCAMQIGQRTGIPVVHTVELLDWATGGPKPF